MAILLALSSALVVGTGDFIGGFASRKGRIMGVVVVGQAVGMLTTVALAPVFGGSLDRPTLVWGALAGLGGGLGIAALYAGFARASIGVVSPVAAVTTASWPVLWDLARGQTPSLIASAGVALGLVGIWVVSGGEVGDQKSTRIGVGFGLLAGTGLGLLLILLSLASEDSGIWALLPARTSGVIVAVVVAAAGSVPIIPAPTALRPAVGAGMLTVLGNGLFIEASMRGSLAVVSVITAMFPAATVVWARIVLGELLSTRRKLGLGLALAAVALVAAG